MKFGLQFEFHKIPEWYTMYLDYQLFKDMIDFYKIQTTDGKFVRIAKVWRFQKDEFTQTWQLVQQEEELIQGVKTSTIGSVLEQQQV